MRICVIISNHTKFVYWTLFVPFLEHSISRKKGGKLKEIAEMNYVRAPWHDGMEEAFSERENFFTILIIGDG